MNNTDIIMVCLFCKETGHTIQECETLKNVVCPMCSGNHTRNHCPLSWCTFCKKMTDHDVLTCPILSDQKAKHTKKACTVCSHCLVDGHSKFDCPVWKSTLTCKECNGKGHTIKNCPSMTYVKCYNCHEYGHYGSSCNARH